MKSKRVIALLCAAMMASGTMMTAYAETPETQTEATEESTDEAADTTGTETTEEDAAAAETTEETAESTETAEAATEESTDEAEITIASESDTYDSRLDAGKIILTPGEDETALNFCWYSEQRGTPAVQMSTSEDFSNASTYIGEATAISKTTDNTAGEGIDYTASNKVTTGEGGIAEYTTYYYRYTWNYDAANAAATEWSEAYTYTSQGFDSFQAILVGDPQIGASGSSGQGSVDDSNIASDLEGWTTTLNMASAIAPNASFILSAGDQIDYSSGNGNGYNIRELEYAGFLTPVQLRSLPVATTIGNHESLGDDYQYHYNNPNSESDLGSTASGSDYYFSYGNVLFIVLNSNNRNAAEHSALMQEAIASDEDATWKVVMFHHDIYGSGSPHSDVDGANLRTIFAPLMDEYDIDVCLTGHDHSYARTYQIIDGKAIDYGATSAVDPDGTLYIAAGSASGSKYYSLNQTKQYYIAERNNDKTPTFSTLDFTDNSFTIKTYDNTGAKYAGDFTITKNVDRDTLLTLVEESEEISASDYTDESYSNYEAAIEEAKTLLETDKDDVPAELTENYDETIQGNNESDPLNYYGYAQDGYGSTSGERSTSTLKEGYSAFLDKTLDNSQAIINAASYEDVYESVVDAKANLVSASVPYQDVEEGAYYYEAAQSLYKKGIMTGMNETTFAPATNLSRAMFVTMIYRMAGSPDAEITDQFKDVADDAWYAEAVSWAVSTGVVTGYENGYFGPADDITREQIVTMLYRYNNLTNGLTTQSTTVLDFPDALQTSAFAHEAMIWAVANDVIRGRDDGNLAPIDNASRADAAVLLARYIG